MSRYNLNTIVHPFSQDGGQVEEIQSGLPHHSQYTSNSQQVELRRREKKATDGGIAMKVKTNVSKAIIRPAKQDLEDSEGGKEISNLHNKQMKDPSKDEEFMQTGSKALSLFQALPIEVHLHVMLNLAQIIDPGLLSPRDYHILLLNNLHYWSSYLEYLTSQIHAN